MSDPAGDPGATRTTAVLALLTSTSTQLAAPAFSSMHNNRPDRRAAPAAALEYARRRAQRGTPLTRCCAPTGSCTRASPTVSSRSWLSRPIQPISPLATLEHVQDLNAGTSPDLRRDRSRPTRANWRAGCGTAARRGRPIRDLLSGAAVQRERDGRLTLGYCCAIPLGPGLLERATPAAVDNHPARARDQATSRGRRTAPPIRCSCRATNRARGPGCPRGSGTRFDPRGQHSWP